jgi:hypothetical protein
MFYWNVSPTGNRRHGRGCYASLHATMIRGQPHPKHRLTRHRLTFYSTPAGLEPSSDMVPWTWPWLLELKTFGFHRFLRHRTMDVTMAIGIENLRFSYLTPEVLNSNSHSYVCGKKDRVSIQRWRRWIPIATVTSVVKMMKGAPNTGGVEFQ